MNTQSVMWVIFMRVLTLLLPFGGCCAVVSHIIYRSNHPYKHPKLAKGAWITVGVLVIGGVITMGFILLQAMYAFTAKSRVASANSNARSLCSAFESAVYDLDANSNLPKHSEEIYSGHCGDKAEENTLEWYMTKYHSDPIYYVIVTDGDWHVIYAYSSNEPITQDKIHPYTYAEQYSFMKNMFRSHKGFVGFYDNAATTKARHEFDKKQKLRELD